MRRPKKPESEPLLGEHRIYDARTLGRSFAPEVSAYSGRTLREKPKEDPHTILNKEESSYDSRSVSKATGEEIKNAGEISKEEDNTFSGILTQLINTLQNIIDICKKYVSRSSIENHVNTPFDNMSIFNHDQHDVHHLRNLHHL